MVAGNHPLLTKTAPLYIYGEIESGNRHAAMVVSAVLLASFAGHPRRPERLPAAKRSRSWRLISVSTAGPPGSAPKTGTRTSYVAPGTLGLDRSGSNLVRDPDPGADSGPGSAGCPGRAGAVSHGPGRPEVQRAFAMSIVITILATVVNTIFGIAFALVLVRQRFWGRSLADGMVDMPFAISPIVAGLMLIVLYGPTVGWAAGSSHKACGSFTRFPVWSWPRCS